MLTRNCQVVIIGAGVTGLSTAYHLRRAGVKDVALFGDPASVVSSRRTANFYLGSLFDNVTRIAHAYGQSLAEKVYRFSNTACQNLLTFCEDNSVPVTRGEHLRLIVSSSEKIESGKAIDLFNTMHIPAESREPQTLGCNPNVVLSLQNDSLGGGCIDAHGLLEKLADTSEIRLERVESITRDKTGCYVQTSKYRWSCDLVVLACHLQISSLLPELTEALVPYSDQWGVYEVKGELPPVGCAMTANHGHEWAVVVSPRRLHIGGARFFRPLAGIGDAEPRVNRKITEYLTQRFQKFLPKVETLNCIDTTPLIDIRPCDELPIISPMYGNERLLLATGFMGNGLSLGFQAGKCMAELICTGESKTLPRELWAERLRSL